MKMQLCTRCSQVYFTDSVTCVHCRRGKKLPLASVFLGLSLLGCASSEKDTASSVDIQNQPENVEPPYGVGALDVDGDGFDTDSDCNDEDQFTHPGAAYAESTTACMTDVDGDGYGSQEPTGTAVAGTDCNDRSSLIHPQAEDTPDDGIDSNCDGSD